MKYEPTIGLEVHVELDTKSKMFCSCPNNAEEKQANTNVCPICLGHPGVLPIINKQALEEAIKVGLALNCKINRQSYFDRKSYFYPDLPKGYQISQKYAPLCKNGYLEIRGKKIKIHEIHLEEDTCRLSHSLDGKHSYVDCNRAGVPLMELVTEPDLKSPQEAKEFAQELQLILRYLEVSKADMEKGQMRIEVNVSLSDKKNKLGIKVELKNINSFKAVEKGAEYEIKRQEKILEQGGEVVQQTRGWDADKGITVLQREKETAHDYRYFPEPDLPLLEFNDEYLKRIKSEIPELPNRKKARLAQEYHLSQKEADLLVQNETLGNYFEKVISELPPGLKPNVLKEMIKLSFNYLTTDLLGLLDGEIDLGPKFIITPENFAKLMVMLFEKKVSSRIGKDVLSEMLKTGGGPSQIVESGGLSQTSNESEIEKIIKQVIAENEKPVLDFKAGKDSALQFLIGKIMAQSRGKANPEIAQKLLKKYLS